MYNDVCYLCTYVKTHDAYLNPIKVLTKKEVWCKSKGVTFREFYAAATADIKPSLIIELADVYDYDNEKIVEYDGIFYDVIRTYPINKTLQITLTTRLTKNEHSDSES